MDSVTQYWMAGVCLMMLAFGAIAAVGYWKQRKRLGSDTRAND